MDQNFSYYMEPQIHHLVKDNEKLIEDEDAHRKEIFKFTTEENLQHNLNAERMVQTFPLNNEEKVKNFENLNHKDSYTLKTLTNTTRKHTYTEKKRNPQTLKNTNHILS